MEIPDRLSCLFTGVVSEKEDSYTIEVPKQEFEMGSLRVGETYRVTLLNISEENTSSAPSVEATTEPDTQGPPVEEGERRTVEIESLGDQGDGLTYVERGYVVIVPDTAPGDRVLIEINSVQQNVAFGDSIEEVGPAPP